MKHIHPVFNVVKLTPAPEDPIAGRRAPPQLLPEIVDREEEWVVEEILDSKVINRKLCYLVKWKDFGVEHNLWEPWDNVHAPELVSEFYRRHPGAPRHIRVMDFPSLHFQPISMSGRRHLEGGVDVRGYWISSGPPTPLYVPPIDVDSGSPNPVQTYPLLNKPVATQRPFAHYSTNLLLRKDLLDLLLFYFISHTTFSLSAHFIIYYFRYLHI